MPNGYSPAERRANVKKQLRDRYGKWIEMGGKIKFLAGGLERIGDVLDIDGDYVVTEVETQPGGRKIRAKVHRNNVEAVSAKANIRNPETGPKIEVADPKRLDRSDGQKIESRDEVTPEALDEMPDGTVIALDRVFAGPYQITYTKDGDGWLRSVEGGAPETQKLPSSFVSDRVSQSLGNNERGLGVVDYQTIFKPDGAKAELRDSAPVMPDSEVELDNENQTNRNELARLDDGTQLIFRDLDDGANNTVFTKNGDTWEDEDGNIRTHAEVDEIFASIFADKQDGANLEVTRRDVAKANTDDGPDAARRAELDQQISDLYEEEQDLIDFGEPQAKIRAVRKKREALEVERDGAKKTPAPAQSPAPIDARSNDLPGEPIEVDEIADLRDGDRIQLFGGGIGDEPVDKFTRTDGVWIARTESGDEFELDDKELRGFIERVDPSDIQRLPRLNELDSTPSSDTDEREVTPLAPGSPEPAVQIETEGPRPGDPEWNKRREDSEYSYRTAISQYRNPDDAAGINADLRAGRPLEEEDQDLHDTLMDLADKTRLVEDATFYRGAVLPGDFEEGGVVRVDSWSSVSSDRKIAESFAGHGEGVERYVPTEVANAGGEATLLEINAPAGTNLINTYHDDVKEFILPPGISLRVDSIDSATPDSPRVIRASLVPSDTGAKEESNIDIDLSQPFTAPVEPTPATPVQVRAPRPARERNVLRGDERDYPPLGAETDVKSGDRVFVRSNGDGNGNWDYEAGEVSGVDTETGEVYVRLDSGGRDTVDYWHVSKGSDRAQARSAAEPKPLPVPTPTPAPARAETPRAKTDSDDFFDIDGEAEANRLVSEAAGGGQPFELERPDGYIARIQIDKNGRVEATLLDPNGDLVPVQLAVEDEDLNIEEALDAMNKAVELDKNPLTGPTPVGVERNADPSPTPAPAARTALAPGEIGQDGDLKFLQDANGNRVYEGSRVKSNKDGLEGEVIKIEGNGLYVKVRGDDGKVRGRRVSTLSLIDGAASQPRQPAPESPEPAPRRDTPEAVQFNDADLAAPAVDAPAVPRGQVGVDNLGRKYVSANDGQPIFKGTKVKSRKDGLQGQVVTIEGNGQYVKILGTDGKVRGRKIDTLDVVSAEELEQLRAPSVQPAPAAPEASAPAPVVLEPPSTDEPPQGQLDPLGLNDMYDGGNGKYRVIGEATAGIMGITDFLEMPNGQRVVRKRITGRHGGNANSEADSEILAGQLAHAMGINEFYAVDGGIDTKGRRVVLMPMIDGKMADDAGYRLGGGYAANQNGDGRMELSNAKEIGILDFLINNSDRHEQNWMVQAGNADGSNQRAIPIDHGGAHWFSYEWRGDYDILSPFSQYFLGGTAQNTRHQLGSKLRRVKLEDIQKTREALLRLREMFVNRDRVDWFDQALEKLNVLEGRLA